MKNRRNYYRILQVQPDAPFEIIRASYHTLMRELKKHPDLGGENWNAQIINEAYETLGNPERRREYDKVLFKSYTKKPCPDETEKKSVITFFCPFCKRPMTRPADAGETCVTCHSPLPSVKEPGSRSDSRRAIQRMRKAGPILYYTNWPQKGKKAVTIDLTPGGMRFECGEKLRPGMLIKISSEMFRAIAKVTNIAPGQDKKYQRYYIGVQFVSLTCLQNNGIFYTLSV